MLLVNFVLQSLYYKMAMQFHNLNFTYELGIPNVVFNRVNKSIIKQATEAIDKKEKRIDMENSKKVGDRLRDDLQKKKSKKQDIGPKGR